MKLIYLFFVVYLCWASAKYLPDPTSASLVTSRGSNRSISNEYGVSIEDSSESGSEDSLASPNRQQLLEIQKKMQGEIENENRELQEKKEKERRKQDEEEERKIQEKIEKVNRNHKEEIENENNEREEDIKVTKRVKAEDLLKNNVYNKYDLTSGRKKLEKEVALKKYVQEELNQSYSERHKKQMKSTPASNGLRNYLKKFITDAEKETIKTKLEEKIRKLEDKQTLLNNYSFPLASLARKEIEETKVLLQTILQYWCTPKGNDVSSVEGNRSIFGSQPSETGSQSNSLGESVSKPLSSGDLGLKQPLNDDKKTYEKSDASLPSNAQNINLINSSISDNTSISSPTGNSSVLGGSISLSTNSAVANVIDGVTDLNTLTTTPTFENEEISGDSKNQPTNRDTNANFSNNTFSNSPTKTDPDTISNNIPSPLNNENTISLGNTNSVSADSPSEAAPYTSLNDDSSYSNNPNITPPGNKNSISSDSDSVLNTDSNSDNTSLSNNPNNAPSMNPDSFLYPKPNSSSNAYSNADTMVVKTPDTNGPVSKNTEANSYSQSNSQSSTNSATTTTPEQNSTTPDKIYINTSSLPSSANSNIIATSSITSYLQGLPTSNKVAATFYPELNLLSSANPSDINSPISDNTAVTYYSDSYLQSSVKYTATATPDTNSTISDIMVTTSYPNSNLQISTKSLDTNSPASDTVAVISYSGSNSTRSKTSSNINTPASASTVMSSDRNSNSSSSTDSVTDASGLGSKETQFYSNSSSSSISNAKSVGNETKADTSIPNSGTDNMTPPTNSGDSDITTTTISPRNLASTSTPIPTLISVSETGARLLDVKISI